MGVLAADAAAEEGFDVVRVLARAAGAGWASSCTAPPARRNPVDAGAGVSPTELADLFDTVLGSGEVDAVLVVPVATGVTDGSLTMTELVRARAQHPEIPVVGVPLGGLPAGSSGHSPDHDLPDHRLGPAGPGPLRPLRRVAGRRSPSLRSSATPRSG